MPKIILEHQLPSNAAPHRRRHSSNTYLGLSPQKRQRVFAAGALVLCCLFLLSISRSGPSLPAVGRNGGGSAGVDSHRVPVRAQGGRLLGGSRQPSLLEQQQQQAKLGSAGEYDANGEDDDDTDRELDGDALEAELGLLPASDDDDPYAPPRASSLLLAVSLARTDLRPLTSLARSLRSHPPTQPSSSRTTCSRPRSSASSKR